jgi:hypothetical protein
MSARSSTELYDSHIERESRVDATDGIGADLFGALVATLS